MHDFGFCMGKNRFSEYLHTTTEGSFVGLNVTVMLNKEFQTLREGFSINYS